jgi:predicted ATP-binding protein involved in virulence
MRVRNLHLVNYRGFADATIDLDRPLTVLAGVNGSGKSSVLTALATLLGAMYGASMQGQRNWAPKFWVLVLSGKDIRSGAEHTDLRTQICQGAGELSVRLHFGTERINRPAALEIEGPHKVPAHNAALMNAAVQTPTVLYGASRSVAGAPEAFEAQDSKAFEGPANVPEWLADALVAGALQFRSFFTWFRQREDVENELKVSGRDLTLEDPQLAAVRRTVASMLPGFSGLRVQRDPLHMVIKKGDTQLALDSLSDGEKQLLTLAADLARRLAIAYAGTPDPLQSEGIVLLDEVELHLHPSWQRVVLARLTKTFPNCQFIATTHSPQVLSEVPNDAVVLVDNFQFVHPGAPTAGRDSNAILEEVMGTSERPDEQRAKIKSISALLDADRYDEARAQLDELAKQLTERDREVVGLRTMLHFLEGAGAADSEGR